MSENFERELGWNDTITQDSKEFVILPAGEYEFRITKFERSRYTPGKDSKLPACNMAIVSCVIESPEGISTVDHRLYLHTRTEGLLSAFFSSIGLKEKDKPATMNWNLVPGATGRCMVGIRKWTGDDGRERESNEIKRFLPREEKIYTNPGASYTPGQF